MKFRIFKNEDGSIIIFTMLILISIMTTSFALMKLVLPKIKIVKEVSYSTIAAYAADSALEFCAYKLRKGSNPPAVYNAGVELELQLSFPEGNGNRTDDSSINDFSTDFVGNGTGWSSAGRFQFATLLSGTNSRVEVSVDSPVISTGDFTWEAWIMPNAVAGVQSIMSFGGTTSLELVLNNANLQARINGSSIVSSIATVVVGQWTHVAVTRLGSSVALYINYVQSGTSFNTTVLNFGTCQTLYIGADAGSGCSTGIGSLFAGKIDEVRIYSVALTQDFLTSSIPVSYNLVMTNGATSSVYYPINSSSTSICTEAEFNHRAVGIYNGIARSFEIFS